MHPLMDIAAEKTPMLPDFGSRQLPEPCEFIDRRLRHPEKPGHIHDGENLAARRRYTIGWQYRCCRQCVIHSEWVIGTANTKLERPIAAITLYNRPS